MKHLISVVSGMATIISIDKSGGGLLLATISGIL